MTPKGNSLAQIDSYYSVNDLVSVQKLYEDLRKKLGIKNDSQLLTFLKEKFALSDSSPSKLLERIYSRLALFNLLSLEDPNDLGLVQLRSDFQLRNLSDIQCSLSHSTSSFACVYTKAKHVSVGIDTEPANRIIADQAKRLFANEKDDASQDLLKLWVQKEAAFKAITHYQVKHQKANKLDLIQGLHEISIQQETFFYKKGDLTGRLLNLDQANHLVKVAYLSCPESLVSH